VVRAGAHHLRSHQDEQSPRKTSSPCQFIQRGTSGEWISRTNPAPILDSSFGTGGGYAGSHRALREMKTDGQIPEDTKVRSSCLNKLTEQDQRGETTYRVDARL
jgi:hypothetical protein